MELGRLLTAMVTPFDSNGKVDFGKTEQLLNHLLHNGTEGLVITGTTGESPTLSHEEKLHFIRFVVQYVNKRIPVIAGTGSNNTAASIALTRQAETIGVDGVMLVTPYYNKPSQEGMYQHFKSIALSTSLPVMLYDIPGRSGVELATETIICLSKIDNIVAIKEATDNLDKMTAIISQTPASFYLYSGDDGLTLPALAVGARGIVSVASHLIGNEMQQMIRYYLNGESSHAAELHQKLLPIMKALFIAPNPTATKEALRMYGIDVGNVRLPLIPLTAEEREHVIHALQLYDGAQVG